MMQPHNPSQPTLNNYPLLVSRLQAAGYDASLHFIEARASRPVLVVEHRTTGEKKQFMGRSSMLGAPIFFMRWLEGIVAELAPAR